MQLGSTFATSAYDKYDLRLIKAVVNSFFKYLKGIFDKRKICAVIKSNK